MYRTAARLNLTPLDVDALSLAQWIALVSGHAGDESAPDASWTADEFKELLARHGR